MTQNLLRWSREQLISEIQRSAQRNAVLVWLVDRYTAAPTTAALAGLAFLSRYVHGLVAARIANASRITALRTAPELELEFFDTQTARIEQPPPVSVAVHPDFKPPCGSSAILTPEPVLCWHCTKPAAMRIGPEYLCGEHERTVLDGERAYGFGDPGFINPCLCDRCSSSAAGEREDLPMSGPCAKCGGRASAPPLCLHCLELELGGLLQLLGQADQWLQANRLRVGTNPAAAVGFHQAVRALRAELERTKAQLPSGPGRGHFWRWAAAGGGA